ncbi:hypothetical protein ACLOAU_08370 [Niabella sp. CJ426]|uniref:hypothetical protein n=1 Tax=Niabella sp. CJ426 TaxID=3393740 RepID=UPI003D03B51C
MIKYVTSFILMLLLFSTSFSQILRQEDFIEIEPPAPGTTEWYPLNQSDRVIKVTIKKGALQLEQTKAMNGDTEYQLPGGLLLSRNGGEFGGGLFYKPFDKRIKRIFVNSEWKDEQVTPTLQFYSAPVKEGYSKPEYFRLPGGNINSFFKFNDTVFFTAGLAHLSSNDGALLKLAISGKDTFTISKVLDLEGAPMTETVVKDTIIFVTHDGLLVVRDLQKIARLKKQFWTSLAPQSVAYLNSHNLYIGMRGCYAKVDLVTSSVRCFKLKR